VEQSGGANSHVYFACNRIGDTKLIKLPDVRPEQIVAARALKRLMTGDLSSTVSSHPPFPWSEAVYLRAQIARIEAGTVLAPAGWYNQEEDDKGTSRLVRAEEIEPVALPEGEPEEWLANWVHRLVHSSIAVVRILECLGAKRNDICAVDHCIEQDAEK
jgi:radial spoke head protein 4/6